MPIPPDPLVYYEGFTLLTMWTLVVVAILGLAGWIGRKQFAAKYGARWAQFVARATPAVIVASLAALLWSAFLDDPRPKITLDSQGITCHRISSKAVSWKHVANLVTEHVSSGKLGTSKYYYFRIFLTPAAPHVLGESAGQGWRMVSCSINAFSTSEEDVAYASVYWRRATGRP